MDQTCPTTLTHFLPLNMKKVSRQNHHSRVSMTAVTTELTGVSPLWISGLHSHGNGNKCKWVVTEPDSTSLRIHHLDCWMEEHLWILPHCDMFGPWIFLLLSRNSSTITSGWFKVLWKVSCLLCTISDSKARFFFRKRVYNLTATTPWPTN